LALSITIWREGKGGEVVRSLPGKRGGERGRKKVLRFSSREGRGEEGRGGGGKKRGREGGRTSFSHPRLGGERKGKGEEKGNGRRGAVVLLLMSLEMKGRERKRVKNQPSSALDMLSLPSSRKRRDKKGKRGKEGGRG